MNKSFFAEILTRKPMLMSKMFQFNQNKMPEIPSSLVELTELGLDVEALWQFKAVRKKYVIATANTTYWNFLENAKRLCLFDNEFLKNLALHFGIAFNAREIIQCVMKDDLIKIRNNFGELLYSFAISRASFTLNYENKFFNILHKVNVDKPIEQKVVLHGLSALYIVSTDWPENLKSNFYESLFVIAEQAEISREDCQELFKSYGEVSPEIKKHFWFSLQKIAAKELGDIWAIYFK